MIHRIRAMLRPGESLAQRTARGGLWLLALEASDRVFSLVRNVVLARLLAPGDFGLFGIAMMALSVLDWFSRTGFEQALIQENDAYDHLNTAWTVQVIRGAFLAGILGMTAPYIAGFFHAPQVLVVVRVLAATALLGGCSNIGVIYFRKELEFSKQFIYALSMSVADFGVAIPAAVMLRSVWALVLGCVAKGVVGLVLSYVLHPYRPRLALDIERVRKLYKFGRWIFGSSILFLVIFHADRAVVGKVLGATALGLYQMGFTLAHLPTSEITRILNQVMFPAYAKLRYSEEELKKAYARVLSVIPSFTIPLSGGVLLLAPALVRIVLGDQWMAMVSAMRLLVVAGLVRSTTALGGPLFLGTGHPHLDFKMNLWRAATVLLTLYPLCLVWGISGAALSILLGIATTIPLWIKWSVRITGVGVLQHLQKLWYSILGTGLMMGILYFFSKGADEANAVGFLARGVLGVSSYVGYLYVVWRVWHRGSFGELRSVVGLFK